MVLTATRELWTHDLAWTYSPIHTYSSVNLSPSLLRITDFPMRHQPYHILLADISARSQGKDTLDFFLYCSLWLQFLRLSLDLLGELCRSLESGVVAYRLMRGLLHGSTLLFMIAGWSLSGSAGLSLSIATDSYQILCVKRSAANDTDESHIIMTSYPWCVKSAVWYLHLEKSED